MSKTTPCSCGEDKCQRANDAEPCWGRIEPVDMREFEGRTYTDIEFLHRCEGHLKDEYEPE